MAVESTGNISIKTAAGSGRSIDTDGRTDISSGSLVTLSTGNVVTSGNTIDGATPHGMLEFRGYTHTQTMSVSETQGGRYSSAGKCAHTDDHDLNSPQGTVGSAASGFTLRASITNTGNNSSAFSLIAYNDYPNFGNSDFTWNASGTQSSWPQGSTGAFTIYTATFTGSGYSSFVPDTFNINYTESGGQVTAFNSQTSFTTATSGGSMPSAYWIDNTDHTYNDTGGTHASGRRWIAVAYNVPPANYDGGIANTQNAVTFYVTFKKSGYYNKVSGTFVIDVDAYANALGY